MIRMRSSTTGSSDQRVSGDVQQRAMNASATTVRRPLVTVVVGSRFCDENLPCCSYYNDTSSCCKQSQTYDDSDQCQQSKEQQGLHRSSSNGTNSLLSGVIFWRARRNKKRSVSQTASGATCLSKATTTGNVNVRAGGVCACGRDQQIHGGRHNQLSPTTSGGYSSGGSDDEARPVKTKLDFSFEQLVKMVKNKSDETALSPDDECLTCVTRRACIQSYPCGHKVLCEKCFVTLLQVNYSEGKYPVTCVFCRSPVALFKRQESPCAVVIKKGADPPGSRSQSAFSAFYAQSPLPSSSIKRPGYF